MLHGTCPRGPGDLGAGVPARRAIPPRGTGEFAKVRGYSGSGPTGGSSRSRRARTPDERKPDALRTFRRRASRVRHHPARHAAAVDQLPGHGRVLRHHLEHGRRLLVLSRRPAAPADPVPLQQRAARPRRPVPLPARRRLGRVLAPRWQPTQRELDDYECRHGLVLHPDHRPPGRGCGPRPCTSSRPARRSRCGGCASATSATGRPPVAVQLGRVLSLGRAGRRDELPAQLLDRRGGGRGRRHLPQDRVPGTARSLRLLRLLRAADRVRHPARGVPRPVPRLGPAAGRGAGRDGRLGRSRLAADGQPSRALPAGPGETREVDLPPRLLGEPARGEVRSARVADAQQDAWCGRSSTASCGRRRSRRDSGAAGVLVDPAVRAPGRTRQTRTPTAWSTSGTRTSAW